jgi:hypothetical protein
VVLQLYYTEYLFFVLSVRHFTLGTLTYSGSDGQQLKIEVPHDHHGDALHLRDGYVLAQTRPRPSLERQEPVRRHTPPSSVIHRSSRYSTQSFPNAPSIWPSVESTAGQEARHRRVPPSARSSLAGAGTVARTQIAPCAGRPAAWSPPAQTSPLSCSCSRLWCLCGVRILCSTAQYCIVVDMWDRTHMSTTVRCSTMHYCIGSWPVFACSDDGHQFTADNMHDARVHDEVVHEPGQCRASRTCS